MAEEAAHISLFIPEKSCLGFEMHLKGKMSNIWRNSSFWKDDKAKLWRNNLWDLGNSPNSPKSDLSCSREQQRSCIPRAELEVFSRHFLPKLQWAWRVNKLGMIGLKNGFDRRWGSCQGEPGSKAHSEKSPSADNLLEESPELQGKFSTYKGYMHILTFKKNSKEYNKHQQRNNFLVIP